MVPINSKKSSLQAALFGCALSPLEARKRANPVQINPEVHPEKSVPSEPCNRIASDEYRVEPELFTVVQPDVCVTEQAASDSAGVNRISGG